MKVSLNQMHVKYYGTNPFIWVKLKDVKIKYCLIDIP